MIERTPRWQFWIDRGGTFTDVVARRPDGSLSTAKLLSDHPERYADAALAGIRQLLGVPGDQPIPVAQIEVVKMGTTVATNALLERKGEPTVLAITRGFRDAPRIGYQNRPRIFDRHIRLPQLLHSETIEIEERVGARGDIILPLDEDATRAALQGAFAAGFRSLAVVLMHAWRFAGHERRVGELARDLGFTQVSLSHEVSPMMRLVARADTTIADAYLSPVLRRYVERVAAELPGVRLLFMQSNGGLTEAGRIRGKDAILSGPAGGIVGMVKTAERAGFDRLIGFDMGGTSTDVSHYAGQFEREFNATVAGVRITAPMMAIHTIAAGGGSILSFDGQRFRVGPESAGANPGPACYRRGGPLTVTDANLMLGKLRAASFPALFGPRGDLPLDEQTVHEKFTALAYEVSASTGQPTSAEVVAEGFIKIAVANMANAIKFISVQRGHDVTGYTLQCFGGAGGQHACLVADELGMRRVLIHPLSGVLSAYGMGLAEQRAMREQSLDIAFDEGAVAPIQDTLDALAGKAKRQLVGEGAREAMIEERRMVHLKYAGTDTTFPVAFADLASMRAQFESAYRSRFGFGMDGRALVVGAAGVECWVVDTTLAAMPVTAAPLRSAAAVGENATCEVFIDGRRQPASIVQRASLGVGDTLTGPALIVEANATTFLERGWRAEVMERGELLLSRVAPRAGRAAGGTAVDPVRLEVFNNLFMSIAEQMGVALANTAVSVNIKERLDFSCALFDAEANLIANAPHMPVHLGSMGESVRTIAQRNAGRMRPGDVFVLNDPFNGGTHLPDVTVVTPVFLEPDDVARMPAFFVASRGHHADIGGITPGSMPPFSKTLEDEGVLIDNFKLVEGGVFREDAMRALLGSGRHPARNVEQNLADLRAQVAANEKGARELARMVAHHGHDVVAAYMRHVQDNAEEMVRRVIDRLADGAFAYEMDSGALIAVKVSVDRAERRATIDFSGTSAQLPSNFNAPSAVVHAAVLYVFRLLVDNDIPLNAGCLKPLTLVIPEGSMLRPRPPAATVAGNVETSQCITDALIGAMGIMAASCGTMNNVTFGNDRYQYYETVSGGSGAGPGFDGCDAVQVHMTNSRLTDPEVLELRYPVRVEEHAIRHGSGGKGRWRGGHGAVRRLRFLEPMTAAILAGKRRVPNFGVHGGGVGALGQAWIEHEDGRRTELAYADQAAVGVGDVFVLQTPGGGGCGRPGGGDHAGASPPKSP
jgi:5-oxoprolinase (ATP-hydrolysing)